MRFLREFAHSSGAIFARPRGTSIADPRQHTVQFFTRTYSERVMWQWIVCYLSGQHEFAMVCEPEEIYLRCRSCGRRSNGWELRSEDVHTHAPATAATTAPRMPRLVSSEALVRR
jgi:hypothetical protein